MYLDSVDSPTITIGMPVFNGEKFITRALNSLRAQEFRDWIIVVADNCSTDATPHIVKEFVKTDPRIKLVVHNENLGAFNNYLYLANHFNSPFFMWAASDDEWSPNYVSECLNLLQRNPDVGFVGGSILNIDHQSSPVRKYLPFYLFEGDKPQERLKSFLCAREVDGKANMIYSIYRKELLQEICTISNIFEGWGSDMAFVAAALARARYMQSYSATLCKRILNESDLNTARLIADYRYNEIEAEGHYPLIAHTSYLSALCRGMPSNKLIFFVKLIMLRRYLSIILKRIFGISI